MADQQGNVNGLKDFMMEEGEMHPSIHDCSIG